MAAYLALAGEEVRLYNRTPDRLDGIRRSGGIHLEGALTGFGAPAMVTSNLAEALPGATVVMVVVPASAHRELARKMAPWLEAGQAVILNPGRTLGSAEFSHELRWAGGPPDVLVAETDTFVFASRWIESGRSRVSRVKKRVRLAALPATRVGEVLRKVRKAFPQLVPATNIIETGICNLGSVFHPAPTLLNAGWIESQHPFDHYHQGITPSVARALEALDAERLAIAQAYRVKALSAKRWLSSVYGSKGRTLHGAIQSTSAYVGLKAPPSLEHRYLFEDVPASLVPLTELARVAGHRARVMESLVTLASAITGVDWVERGRTLESVGLADMGVVEILEYVNSGLKRTSRWPARRRFRVPDGDYAEADAAISLEGT